MKAYFIILDIHVRQLHLILDVTAEILKFKTVALEILSSTQQKFQSVTWHLVSSVFTVNFLNIRTPKTFVVITLKFELCGSIRVVSPNDADGMTNSVDPDQTAPLAKLSNTQKIPLFQANQFYIRSEYFNYHFDQAIYSVSIAKNGYAYSVKSHLVVPFI